MKHWTCAEKLRVAEMLKRGMTAAQIARHFDGRSRNAVIGFVNRYKDLKSIGFKRAA